MFSGTVSNVDWSPYEFPSMALYVVASMNSKLPSMDVEDFKEKDTFIQHAISALNAYYVRNPMFNRNLHCARLDYSMNHRRVGTRVNVFCHQKIIIKKKTEKYIDLGTFKAMFISHFIQKCCNGCDIYQREYL